MMKTILILDDFKEIRKELEYHLSKRGYRVLTAGTVAEAKRYILTDTIDYAIVDLKIDYESEYGGINVVNYIKKIQPLTRTLILSAYKLDEKVISMLDSDVDGYVDKGGFENYIIAIVNKLREFELNEVQKRCFVIMPFSSTPSCTEVEWTEIFEKLIKPAVEKSGYGYICQRSEALFGNVIEGILKELNRADIVIADLTDRNPNVYYELGVRQSIRDKTILIAQRLEDIPFDLKTQATHIYDWKLSSKRNEFKKKIAKLIEMIEKDPSVAQSPIKKYLSV